MTFGLPKGQSIVGTLAVGQEGKIGVASGKIAEGEDRGRFCTNPQSLCGVQRLLLGGRGPAPGGGHARRRVGEEGAA